MADNLIAVIVAVITGGSAVVASVIAYGSKKKLKEMQAILDALGTQKEGKTLTAQIGDIADKIGDTSGRISDKIGSTSGGDLKHQHDAIFGRVERLNAKADAADRKTASLVGREAEIKEAVDKLAGFGEIIANQREEILSLHAEISRLREDTEKPVGLIKSKERDIRAEEKTKGGCGKSHPAGKDGFER